MEIDCVTEFYLCSPHHFISYSLFLFLAEQISAHTFLWLPTVTQRQSAEEIF